MINNYINHLLDAQSTAARIIVIIISKPEEGLEVSLFNLFILQMQKNKAWLVF